MARLEEANEARVSALVHGSLVLLEEVLPVHAPLLVFFRVGILAQLSRHLRDAEVVVRILKGSGYGSSHCAKALNCIRIVSQRIYYQQNRDKDGMIAE